MNSKIAAANSNPVYESWNRLSSSQSKPASKTDTEMADASNMPESLKTHVLRWLYNLWPCYWGTGVRIKYLASDFREMRIEVPLNWRTRNYVGTVFGGSMYGAVDPPYMLMLIKNLGSGYEVWDKTATIHFKKPGRSTLRARFMLDEKELQRIGELALEGSVDRVYSIDLTNDEGVVCATIEKTVHIRKRNRAPLAN